MLRERGKKSITKAVEKPGAKSSMLAIRLQPHMQTKLKAIAAAEGKTASEWIRSRIRYTHEALQKKRARENPPAQIHTPTE